MTPFQTWHTKYLESRGIGKNNQAWESQGDVLEAWDAALEYAKEHLEYKYMVFGWEIGEFLDDAKELK